MSIENLVSIITPNFNSNKYLKDTIYSVLNQTYKNFEWIIIDDKSTDNSVEILNSINDSRVKVILLDKNSGAAVARNKGIEIAKGRFITFIDSDDLWLPNFLETTVNFLLKKNVELVYTAYKRVDENLNPYLSDFIGTDKVNYSRLLYNCPLPMLTTIYDAKRIGKIKIPIVDKREDYAMWLTILKSIKYAYVITTPLAIYRIRKNSYSSNKFKMGIKQFNLLYNFLNLGLIKSTYYTLCWAINGIIKYGRI